MNKTDDGGSHVTVEPQLRVYLFGPLRATWQGVPLKGLTRPQLQALWAYLLLLHRNRPVPREHLAFTFWPGGSETQARNSLRQHLYLLRQGLPSPTGFLAQRGGETEGENVPWLLLDPDEVRVNPQAQLWVDVWEFEDSLARGEAELETAVRLAGADLLPDLYDDWLNIERERLRISYTRALTRLVLLKQRQGDRAAALAWARRLVAHDTANEEAHRLLIAVQYANGDRTAALAQFKECQRILRDEIGVAPSPATLALREAVMQNRPLPAPWSDIQPLSETNAPLILPETVSTSLPGALTMPFVGREAELRFLVERWHLTTAPAQNPDKAGSIVLVGGEAGVGKTRLLSELAGQVERSGGQVLWGHCYSFERNTPYQPLVEALRAALPQLASSSISLVWLAEAARMLPDLRELRPDIPEPAELQGEQAQVRLIEGLCRCLLVLAEQRSLLLILEDLHWAADSSLSWLHAMARQVGSNSLLIVGSYRQEEIWASHPVRDWMREVRRQGWGALLTLQPLAGEAVQRLVQALSGLGEHSTTLAQRLQAESEGNPFFLSELLRHLQEIGEIYTREGSWVGSWIDSVSAGGKPSLPLPESVRDAIVARVARLSEAQRELLGYAAVAGREFDLKVVRAAIGWEEEETLDALEELLSRGLIREGTLETRRDHVFNHHLVQEVIYNDLPRGRRQMKHRRVGEAMVVAYGEELSGELAHHFEQAGEKEQARKYLRLAGERAAARYANAEALDYFGRAIAILPDEASETRFSLLKGRFDVLWRLGRWEEQRTDLEALEATARALQDDLRLAQTYLLWTDYYEKTVDFVATTEAAQKALALFQQEGDRLGEAESLSELGAIANLQHDYSKARPLLQSALELYQGLGDRRGQATTLRRLGLLSKFTFDYTSARIYWEQALALAREIGDRDSETLNLLRLGEFFFEAGDYVTARAIHVYGLELAHSIGNRVTESTFLMKLGNLCRLTGEFSAAEEYSHRAFSLGQSIDYTVLIDNAYNDLASSAWQLGDDIAALQLWEKKLELEREPAFQSTRAWTLVCLGHLMRQRGEYVLARTYMEQAFKLIEHTGSGGDKADLRYRLGLLYWAEGEIALAFNCWREAATLFEGIFQETIAQANDAQLAETLVALNQADEACQLADRVWTAWKAKPPLVEMFDEVRQGYLALARTFAKLDEPQTARACLEQAHAFIQGRLANISDDSKRQSFLTRVPVNREIEAAYAGIKE